MGSDEREYYFFEGDTKSYYAWAGFDSLPTLNYTSEKLRDEIYRAEDSVLRKWLKPPYSIDGWRFDVADVFARKDEIQLDHELWPEIRRAIREENPDAYILAEDWGDCSQYLQGEEWDSPMNYFGCARPVREFVGDWDLFLVKEEVIHQTKPNQSGKALAKRIRQHLCKIPFALQQVQFNLLGSHDASRLHNNPNISWEAVKVANVLLFTLPGTASIYYGDEAGIDGRMEDTEGCRYPMPWDKDFKKEAPYKCYQTLAHMKRENKAFCGGGFKILWEEGKVFAFARFTEEQLFYVVCSMERENAEITLPYDIFGKQNAGNVKEIFGCEVQYEDCDGNIVLTVPGQTAYVMEL